MNVPSLPQSACQAGMQLAAQKLSVDDTDAAFHPKPYNGKGNRLITLSFHTKSWRKAIARKNFPH